MDDKQTPSENKDDSLESLENPASAVEASDNTPAAAPVPEQNSQSADSNRTTLETAEQPIAPSPKGPGLRKRFSFLNIYLLIFMFIVVAVVVVCIYAYSSSKRINSGNNISSQTLDQKALEQLANTGSTVGSSDQVLNVQSSAVFANQVLVRNTLEVAGQLKVGGALTLPGLTVSGGNSSFDQAQVNKNLAVAGDTGLQGALSVQKSLTVNGTASFGGSVTAGQLTVSGLTLNGDLNLTHHITAGGSTPGRSNGSALGSGGTSSVSGSDTSGSVSIGTGSGPAAGCFITVNFASKFNSTPHVIITPVGSSAAGIPYYVNRSTTSFSICTTSPPPANASFGFDYLALD